MVSPGVVEHIQSVNRSNNTVCAPPYLSPCMYDVEFNPHHTVQSWSFLLPLFHRRGIEKCLNVLYETMQRTNNDAHFKSQRVPIIPPALWSLFWYSVTRDVSACSNNKLPIL